jgi:hypothetical protein
MINELKRVQPPHTEIPIVHGCTDVRSRTNDPAVFYREKEAAPCSAVGADCLDKMDVHEWGYYIFIGFLRRK